MVKVPVGDSVMEKRPRYCEAGAGSRKHNWLEDLRHCVQSRQGHAGAVAPSACGVEPPVLVETHFTKMTCQLLTGNDDGYK